jgi:hypothetical protein
MTTDDTRPLSAERLRAWFLERGWSIYMDDREGQPLDPFPVLAALLGSEYHPFTVTDTWRALAHDFRVYAQHAPNCAYRPTYPESGTATCDCAFDVLLDRYDRLSAT